MGSRRHLLKLHFEAAKVIWENLLPGSGSYDLDFEWDDDIDPLGLTSPDLFNPGGWIIEMNSDTNWFADLTPDKNEEFETTPTQTLYGTLSASDQSTYFPGASPPLALETGFILVGTEGSTAHDNFDLLSVILHEIGHVIGIHDILPGDWPLDPQHIGGLEDVSVLGTFAIPGGTHLAGDVNVPGFLMNPGTPPGVRILPSATDVLAIAENQGINNVHLVRVERISAGNWNNTNAWIGADVPDATQDAYVRQGGAVTLDVNASVKSLLIDSSTVDVQGRALTSGGDVNLVNGTLAVGAGGSIISAGDVEIVGGTIAADGSITSGDVKLVDGTIAVGAGGSIKSGDVNIVNGSLSVASGGSLTADKIDGDPATLTTAAGSTVEFNNFTRGTSSATAATFNGNVKIGVGDSEELVTFNPDTRSQLGTLDKI